MTSTRQAIGLAVGLVAAATIIAPCWAQVPSVNGGGVSNLDLETQLDKGLKARRPVEFAYIKQIVALVNSGQLPRSTVISTFGWARKQPNRQLQYFQFALQARTKGLGIPLPDITNQGVGLGSNGGQHGFGSP
jgi:hypothetical protein